MCAQNQPYPTLYHSLISAYGSEWSERLVAVFTAYIDDSGTAPDQMIASATALVLPASRLAAFHSEWKTFSDKWGVTDFHASECANANKKSDFAGWDDPKINAAFKRIRQIIRRYSVRAISLSVNKDYYEANVPVSERGLFGNFYFTYAVQNLLIFLDDYALKHSAHPMEYVFDWIDAKTAKHERREVEDALARTEEVRPGRFAGHYSFRKRREVPGLQCVDLVAWACYRQGVETFGGPKLTPLQAECLAEFEKRNEGEWLTAVGQILDR